MLLLMMSSAGTRCTALVRAFEQGIIGADGNNPRSGLAIRTIRGLLCAVISLRGLARESRLSGFMPLGGVSTRAIDKRERRIEISRVRKLESWRIGTSLLRYE